MASDTSNASDTNENIQHQLKILRRSLRVQVPFTSGLHAVKGDDLVVYYEVPGEKRPFRIDLANATEEELVELTAACQKATFGVGGKDVFDESYRKAGKMDVNNFTLRFDVASLLKTISPEILQGRNADDSQFLRAEMYKLNVYGPGSFFKAHQDTPRSEEMIASLVVVFPTAHEGGELKLEHGGKRCLFDSADMLAEAPQLPALAYVAFYSDVTHSVETVLTGYRVTLTYNLYLCDRKASPEDDGSVRYMPAHEQNFEEALYALLEDPDFLPKGGLLSFGLAHQYPFPAPPDRLPQMLHLLKGSDAIIHTVAEKIGLTTQLKVFYEGGVEYWSREEETLSHHIFADDVLNVEHINESYDMCLWEELEKLGEQIQHTDGGQGVDVQTVTGIDERNRVRSNYTAYGNEAEVGHVYGDAGLVVRIPAIGEGVRAYEEEEDDEGDVEAEDDAQSDGGNGSDDGEVIDNQET
ncbi:hypothetical protein FB45DRAFT_1018152 [Roridomyces roridus]|uniref:Fe2OG dioxygenase domain-containing protein n=1 Tax=Roridomyces roridus TaxID=1738132 RepID=A0AAD7CK57_9AGAR|nr:hypothetical protein FB45DRAFT_1018152 [Roridomyces roridus]